VTVALAQHTCAAVGVIQDGIVQGCCVHELLPSKAIRGHPLGTTAS